MPKRRAEPTTEQQLSGWKLLERFIGALDQHGSRIAPNHREEHGLRDLNRRAVQLKETELITPEERYHFPPLGKQPVLRKFGSTHSSGDDMPE